MVYTRGSKDDFDRFARITEDEGWSWDNLVPYMHKTERFSPPADNHNTTGQFNPAVHGFDGINTVSLAGFPTSIDSRIIKTTSQLDERPFNLDMNSGDHLDVGERFTLTAKKEVVLPVGSIGTPHLLLHSGIANSSMLTSLEIKTIHNLPSVGENLTDHTVLGLSWLVNSIDTWDTAGKNTTLSAAEFEEWNTTRTGPSVDSAISHLGWIRIPDNSSIFQFKGVLNPAAGKKLSALRDSFLQWIAWSDTFHRKLPDCGSVVLKSSNPLNAPLINPILLGVKLDVLILIEALRSVMRFVEVPAWAGYIISPLGNVTNDSTDEESEVYIRNTGTSLYHPVGTASMSAKGAPYGVVDPDLRVKGLTGLEIVDASIISGNPLGLPSQSFAPRTYRARGQRGSAEEIMLPVAAEYEEPMQRPSR
ncbi:alcohol oxidase [Mycena crocata]|nr:alcohol oxidase [Mycena crocata]